MHIFIVCAAQPLPLHLLDVQLTVVYEAYANREVLKVIGTVSVCLFLTQKGHKAQLCHQLPN